jgi:pantoate--beta-alanine ligase
MTSDLGLPVEIVGVPTVREPDGLALSSRNAYLSQDERDRAVALPHTLQAARRAILAGASASEALTQAKDALSEAGFSRVDYFALVDAETLEPMDEASEQSRLIAAAVIGTTRLIDNLAM